MTDITFINLPDEVIERVKHVVTQVVTQNIRITDLQPTQDQIDLADAKLVQFKKDNNIIDAVGED